MDTEVAVAVGSASGSMAEGISAETLWSMSERRASSDSVVCAGVEMFTPALGVGVRCRFIVSGKRAATKTTTAAAQ